MYMVKLASIKLPSVMFVGESSIFFLAACHDQKEMNVCISTGKHFNASTCRVRQAQDARNHPKGYTKVGHRTFKLKRLF
eukprot:m.228068 g.228068  ORF g.228068 m.228068 type:complete len:79 (+) comp17050_c5_seq2:3755-3991(+)